MRYIDLMGGQKPHLLVHTTNNMGAETDVQYAASTKFYLEEENFLGWGKTLQISHCSNVDRTSNTVQWKDPNVFGSRWTSAITLANSSDGRQRSVAVAQPSTSLAPMSIVTSATVP